MLHRLVTCWVFWHKWTEWKYRSSGRVITTYDDGTTYVINLTSQTRVCRRCGKIHYKHKRHEVVSPPGMFDY